MKSRRSRERSCRPVVVQLTIAAALSAAFTWVAPAVALEGLERGRRSLDGPGRCRRGRGGDDLYAGSGVRTTNRRGHVRAHLGLRRATRASLAVCRPRRSGIARRWRGRADNRERQRRPVTGGWDLQSRKRPTTVQSGRGIWAGQVTPGWRPQGFRSSTSPVARKTTSSAMLVTRSPMRSR